MTTNFKEFIEITKEKIPDNFENENVFMCPACGEPITYQLLEHRDKQQVHSIFCDNCTGNCTVRPAIYEKTLFTACLYWSILCNDLYRMKEYVIKHLDKSDEV